MRPLYLATIVLVAASCNFGGSEKQGDDTVVATVYGQELLLSELNEHLLDDAGPDSVELAKAYIDEWIRTQVVLHQAEASLPEERKDKERQVRDYRNSLIIYEYQQQLIEQKLDTLVTDSAIVTYYNENKADFELKENIVKLSFVKLPANAPKLDNFAGDFRTMDESNRQKVLDYAARYSLNSFFEEDTWLAFNDVLKEIPITTYDQEAFLRNNRFIRLENEGYIYLVRIHDFRIKNDISPLNFEKLKIRNILLNQRKQRLIFDMENQALRNAESGGHVKINK